MTPRRVDPWAAAAALLAAVMVGVYLGVIRQQDGDAAVWFVAMVVLGAATAAYGAMSWVRLRRPALVVASVLLVATGVLGILSIGFPILVAGVLGIVATVRASPSRAPTG